MRDFKPGDKIEVLIYNQGDTNQAWAAAKILDVLSTQVTFSFERYDTTAFLFKSDFGSTWRMA